MAAVAAMAIGERREARAPLLSFSERWKMWDVSGLG